MTFSWLPLYSRTFHIGHPWYSSTFKKFLACRISFSDSYWVLLNATVLSREIDKFQETWYVTTCFDIVTEINGLSGLIKIRTHKCVRQSKVAHNWFFFTCLTSPNTLKTNYLWLFDFLFTFVKITLYLYFIMYCSFWINFIALFVSFKSHQILKNILRHTSRW